MLALADDSRQRDTLVCKRGHDLMQPQPESAAIQTPSTISAGIPCQPPVLNGGRTRSTRVARR
ncbi:hypothetical protein ACFOSS_05470 [Pseudaeromonas sharmana]|uniref:Uncharacterized protein n=1 Tax=Pseudaeromonas sharmana TaxID=328412 RepID=A0ABV8CL42_9GAMM